jgi:hypothetical protein
MWVFQRYLLNEEDIGKITAVTFYTKAKETEERPFDEKRMFG